MKVFRLPTTTERTSVIALALALGLGSSAQSSAVEDPASELFEPGHSADSLDGPLKSDAVPEPSRGSLRSKEAVERIEYFEADILATQVANGATSDGAIQRLRMEDAVVGMSSFVRQMWPEEFAGIWIAEGSDAFVHVAFKAPIEVVEQRIEVIKDHFAYPEMLVGEAAELSEAEMDSLLSELVELRDQDRLTGVAVLDELGGSYDVSTKPQDGKVHVSVPESSSSEAVGTLLQSHFDTDAISVGTDLSSPDSTCSDVDCRPYMFAGLWVVRNAEPTCTFGFTVKTHSGADRTFSAGHCRGTYRGHGWLFDYDLYGDRIAQRVAGNLDVEVIRPLSSSWQHRGWFFADGEIRIVTGAPSHSWYEIGTQVGMTGWASSGGDSSVRGRIQSLNASPSHVTNGYGFIEADYCREDGDSGGPVFRHNLAVGIHSAGGGCTGYFTRTVAALDYWGFDLNTPDLS